MAPGGNHGGQAYRKVHLGAIALALIALPWSEFLLSISQFILVGNWLWEGVARNDLGGRFKQAFTQKESLVFLSFFGLHLLGLAWTTDLQWGVDLCRILLPVLAFGAVLASVPRLSAGELRTLLLLGAWSATASTFACLAMRHGVLAQGNYRDLSPFIGHIMLGLMLCFSIAVFIHYWPRSWPLRTAHLLAVLQCLVFINLMSSLTDLPVLSALALYGLWRMARMRRPAWRWAAFALLLAGGAGLGLFLRGSWEDYRREDRTQLEHLPHASAGGEVYYHDLRDPQRENGHYVWVNVADKELERTWDRRSTMPFNGKDKLGQPLRSTLVRYLASMGLRKDSTGVQQLSAQDVARIQQGITSVEEGRAKAMRARVEQVLYELDRYRHTGDPNGHSATMRLEYWRAGLRIARDHWLFGVGTGDTQRAFDAMYEQEHSVLAPEWRHRAHNEFLTLFISFGVFGLLWSLFSWWWPAWRCRAFAHPLFIAWGIIFLLACLTDDTVETQMGATFFALYYALFAFAAPPASASTS